jgi:uncharacterized membrane protein
VPFRRVNERVLTATIIGGCPGDPRQSVILTAFIYRKSFHESITQCDRTMADMAEEKAGPFRFHFEVREKPYDLVVAIALALILIALVVFLPDSLARQVLGLIFVLFLPGYVATAALFPENEQIDGIERVALSFGLSIAIVPLIGLALNFTPFGIRLDPILASVSAFIVGAAVVGWYRRMRLPADERFAIVVDFEMDWKGMPMIDKLLTIGIAAMLVASVVVLAWAITTPREGESFTQLAILGPGGMATDYPRNLTVGEDARVLLSVRSYEHDPMDYTIVLVLTTVEDYNFTVGQDSINWNSTNQLEPHVAIAQNFSLEHLEYYNHTFDFNVSSEGMWKLQFLLYTEGQDYTQDSYREVHLWLNVTPET